MGYLPCSRSFAVCGLVTLCFLVVRSPVVNALADTIPFGFYHDESSEATKKSSHRSHAQRRRLCSRIMKRMLSPSHEVQTIFSEYIVALEDVDAYDSVRV